MENVINGQDLINAGLAPGKWFGKAIDAANAALARGENFESAIQAARTFEPGPTAELHPTHHIPFHLNIDAENEDECENVANVKATMVQLMRTPVVKAGAVMPDACPAGPNGTIPVGGIVASEAIHPGMHSADICCSMAISVFPGVSPRALLDAVHKVTHFGPGGRPRGQQYRPSDKLIADFESNRLLAGGMSQMIEHFGTQGDGNHFAYVGTLQSTDETVLVTHHGSRGPGARLYASGMRLAESFRAKLSPETLRDNAWIPADCPEGDLYWEALQLMRLWTKENHFVIHDTASLELGARVADRFWNEHNFVFRKSDGLFYHAKGATPAFDGWAEDATDLTIIPLNMAEPILIVRGKNAPNGLGFSPHGAGRNFSRTKHKLRLGDRSNEEVFAEETRDIDARFYCGHIDLSELPSAYKNAAKMRRQIKHYGLADIVDQVIPYGSIMAGDTKIDPPWLKRKKRKQSSQ